VGEWIEGKGLDLTMDRWYFPQGHCTNSLKYHKGKISWLEKLCERIFWVNHIGIGEGFDMEHVLTIWGVNFQRQSLP
jgi:hypothetical protein